MDLFVYVRIICGLLFVATLAGGLYLLKNLDRLVAHHYENSGASGLNKVQIIIVWLHALALTGAFAFLMH